MSITKPVFIDSFKKNAQEDVVKDNLVNSEKENSGTGGMMVENEERVSDKEARTGEKTIEVLNVHEVDSDSETLVKILAASISKRLRVRKGKKIAPTRKSTKTSKKSPSIRCEKS